LSNKNRLICSSKSNSDGVKIEQNYSINHNDDTVTNVTVTKLFAYDDQAKFDTFKDVVAKGTDANMSKLANANIHFSSNINNKTYSTKLQVNVANANKSELTKLGLNKSLAKTKTDLESQGLVCK
jgi:hypothetical protein